MQVATRSVSHAGGPLSRRWRVASRRAPICLAAFGLDLLLWGGDTGLRWGGEVPAALVLATGIALYTAIAALPEARRLTFALAFVYSVAWTILIPHYQPFTALLLVLYYLARSMPMRPALPYLLATVVPWALHTANSVVVAELDAPAALIPATLWFVMTALAWMAGRYGFRLEETARLREEAVSTEALLARQEDRLALSRELHDVLSHSMGAIALQAAGAKAIASAGNQPLDPRVAGALEMIATTSTDSMRELRRLLGFLRDNGAVEVETSDGPIARIGEIGVLVDRTRACGIAVASQTVGTPFEMPTRHEHAAYRVVQEGLANVLRHGGRGSRALLTLTWSDAGLTIDLLTRAGMGRDPAVAEHGSGLGLRGLEARLKAVGGTLQAGPEGETFHLTATIPKTE